MTVLTAPYTAWVLVSCSHPGSPVALRECWHEGQCPFNKIREAGVMVTLQAAIHGGWSKAWEWLLLFFREVSWCTVGSSFLSLQIDLGCLPSPISCNTFLCNFPWKPGINWFYVIQIVLISFLLLFFFLFSKVMCLGIGCLYCVLILKVYLLMIIPCVHITEDNLLINMYILP